MNNKDKVFVQPQPSRRPAAYEIEVARNLLLKSSGAGAGNWIWFDISPVLEGLAPCLDQLVVHLVQEERSSVNLNHRVQLNYSADGLTWVTGADIIPSQNTEGYTISSAFTTRTQFGRFMKVRLGLEDNGTAYTGRFSVWLDIKLWT